MKTAPEVPDAKKLFLKLGTCSRTMFFILNREFGHPEETKEAAADPMAGGIMGQGYQCGMLWGATLAAGAESFRRFKDTDQASAMAINATQHILDSFENRAHTHNCREVTNCNLTNIFGMLKLILFKPRTCFNLLNNWAPDAIQSASEGLSGEQAENPGQAINCASEVARKMCANDEEMVTVAGLAGGMGLSGNGCGALAAAIWMNSMAWLKKENRKSAYNNPKAKNTLKAFMDATESKFRCREITDKQFNTIEEHTEYMKNGGCKDLIDILAGS